MRFALLIVAAIHASCAADECTPYFEYSCEPVPNATSGCIGLSFQGYEQADRTLVYPLGCHARAEQCSGPQGPYGSRTFSCYAGGGWLELLRAGGSHAPLRGRMPRTHRGMHRYAAGLAAHV